MNNKSYFYARILLLSYQLFICLFLCFVCLLVCCCCFCFFVFFCGGFVVVVGFLFVLFVCFCVCVCCFFVVVFVCCCWGFFCYLTTSRLSINLYVTVLLRDPSVINYFIQRD